LFVRARPTSTAHANYQFRSFDAFASSKDTAVTEQTLYFAGDQISISCPPSKRTLEIPAFSHFNGTKHR